MTDDPTRLPTPSPPSPLGPLIPLGPSKPRTVGTDCERCWVPWMTSSPRDDLFVQRALLRGRARTPPPQQRARRRCGPRRRRGGRRCVGGRAAGPRVEHERWLGHAGASGQWSLGPGRRDRQRQRAGAPRRACRPAYRRRCCPADRPRCRAPRTVRRGSPDRRRPSARPSRASSRGSCRSSPTSSRAPTPPATAPTASSSPSRARPRPRGPRHRGDAVAG